MGKTKTRFKDFGATQALEDYEPLGFALNGEDFTCRPAMAGAVLLDFVRRADTQAGGAAADAVIQFLEDALEEGDRERFMGMIRDPEVIVEIDTLAEIAAWLIEQYTERPTKPRPRSAGGRSSLGRGSTDTSPDEE